MAFSAAAAEAELARWMDEARERARRGRLRHVAALTAAAAAKCADMAAGGAIAHATDRWKSPRALQEAFGVRAAVMGGENLAACRDAARAFQAMMASPGHRDNILHPAHDAVGIAVRPVRYGCAVCMEFAGRLLGVDGRPGTAAPPAAPG